MFHACHKGGQTRGNKSATAQCIRI